MPVESPESPILAIKPTPSPTPSLHERMLKCSCVAYVRQLLLEQGVPLDEQFPKIQTPADLSGNSIPYIGGILLYKIKSRNGGWVDHMGLIHAWDLNNRGIYVKHRYLSGDECITTIDLILWEDFRGVYKGVNPSRLQK